MGSADKQSKSTGKVPQAKPLTIHALASILETARAETDVQSVLAEMATRTTDVLGGVCAVILLERGLRREPRLLPPLVRKSGSWAGRLLSSKVLEREADKVLHSSGDIAILRLAGEKLRPFSSRFNNAGGLALESCLCLAPLQGSKEPLGVLAVYGGHLVAADLETLRSFVTALARLFVLAIDTSRAHNAQVEARRQAEEAAWRTAAVQATTAFLLSATTLDEACSAAMFSALEIMDCPLGAFALKSAEGSHVHWSPAKAGEALHLAQFASIPITSPHPMASAVRDGDVVVMSGKELEALDSGLALAFGMHANSTLIAVPLDTTTAGVIGATAVVVPQERQLTGEDLAMLRVVAGQAAQTITKLHTMASLEDADRRKDEFIAMLSHELRNPLAPIEMALHLLSEEGEKDERKSYLYGIVSRQVGNLKRLVDDLLDVSRITRGKIHLQKARLDARKILEQALDSSRDNFSAKQQKLSVDVDSAPAVVDADAVRLEQIFINLLTNASKYTPKGGRIEASLHRSNQHYDIAITDSGVGIEPTLLPHIFDLFVQADRSLARSEGGLGIGLTVAQRLARLHDGELRAYSEGRGRGSKFVLRLPAAAHAHEPHAVAGTLAEAQPAVREHSRVLVVDDNPDVTATLSRIFAAWGHEVETASDGQEALDCAAVFNPEIVILDIGLPRLSGFDVAKTLRQRMGSDVLIAALTGYGRSQDRELGDAVGFDHYFVKPVDIQQLAHLVGRSALSDPR